MELLNYKIYSETNNISFTKPILVFLHGFGGNSCIWLKQIKPLKKEFDLLLIDLPSHGKSKVLLSEMNKTFESIVDKIIEVLDYLHIKKATFVGCSLGTMFVKYIVVKKRELVDKFILIGGIGFYKNWLKCGIQVAKVLLTFLPRKLCCNIVATMLIPNKESAESRKLFLECCKNIPKKELACWLRVLARFPKINKMYLEIIDKLDNGLYITGDRDIVFIPTLQEEFKKISNIKILKDCGHVCNIDKAKEVNDLILDFI